MTTNRPQNDSAARRCSAYPATSAEQRRSGTIGELAAFNWAHGVHVNAKRGDDGIWRARMRNARVDVTGQGLDVVTAIANAVEKLQDIAAGGEGRLVA